MRKSIIANHAKDKVLKNNIFKIADRANKMKKEHDDIIDATLGMLTHENGKVFKYSAIDYLLKNFTDKHYYPYAPFAGTRQFREGVMNWVFGKHLNNIKETFHTKVIPTAGGTGAISNTVYNFNNYNEKILIPNYFWPAYENIADESNVKLEKYDMYDENHDFNIKGFKESAIKLAKEQDKLFVVINDPCNNPTGLELGEENWEKVVMVLNEISSNKVPVVLLLDIAYIDYEKDGYDSSRELFKHIINLHEEILTVISFSASKSFSIYGLRLGAQIGLSKKKKIINEFTRVNEHSLRARFSNVNHPAMRAVGKIFTITKYRESYIKELELARELLKKRADEFTRIAQEENLDILPYGGGFFIAIETNKENIFEKLIEEHIFVIAFPGLIRIAISSLQFSQMEKLVRALKKHV